MDELGLQLLQTRFGLLPLSEIANKAREKSPFPRLHFANGELHGKGRTILALSDDDAADPDDASLACCPLALQVGIVAFTIGKWHQSPDILSESLVGAISEQAFGGTAERLHDAAFINHDHGLRN